MSASERGPGTAGETRSPGTAASTPWEGHGPSLEDALARAWRHAEAFTPARGERARLAVVTCMDRRLDVMTLFDLKPGDAYVIRNAGGILTEDVRRSLAIAQHELGVEQVVLVHHTDCGMSRLDDEGFVERLVGRTGVRPRWTPGGFRDVADDVRRALRELAADPHVPGGAAARGFVYDVDDGTLTEVRAA
ncbi:MAG: carbonic anhydrase [Actinomyces sp.]|uniref:beta-class carbonic anhydrase n=1 Tax=Actinomyces sp. TaxID=29317 RepID=UPI0026DAB0F9|nr:carbonic anhydrase [Actinomyces sp.]MDO4242403.1 carbonic anhydrase [Actinomyces sp.]